MLRRGPFRKVFVPITHYLVHATTVHNARQVAHLLYEVAKERRARPKFQMVDVTIQGLVQFINELCHGTKSPSQVLGPTHVYYQDWNSSLKASAPPDHRQLIEPL
jgi:hypothetical protein